MNVSPGAQVRPLNTQILMATMLVTEVSRDIQSLLPQALREGTVTVGQGRVEGWQSSLQQAVSLLSTIPVPLIFPPPPFVMFIQGAVRQIEQALATLATITFATPAIFPPVPGQASVSLETLQFVLNDLEEATLLLIRALQNA